MKYEYIELYSGDNSVKSLIDQINEKGQEGYKLITSSVTSEGDQWALMERQFGTEIITKQTFNP
jgi:hypothetical protein